MVNMCELNAQPSLVQSFTITKDFFQLFFKGLLMLNAGLFVLMLVVMVVKVMEGSFDLRHCTRD